MIRLFIIISILLLSSPAYSADLMATGYDYVLMNDNQKDELVTTLFKILQRQEIAEQGVVSLDSFYYIYFHEVENSKNGEAAVKRVFERPVMEILAEILTQSPDTKYDETMMKKYELNLKGTL